MALFYQNRQLNKTQNFPKNPEHYPEVETFLGDYESEEDDLYLFDILTEQPPVLHPDHRFTEFIDELTASTLENFLRGVQLRKLPHIVIGPQFQASKFKTFDKNIDLERAPNENDRDSTLDESFAPPKRRFACPFYIRNPEKHMVCLTRANLQGIKDIKQHLWNAHQLPPYCPRCGEIFPTTRSCDDHIRYRSCDTQEIQHPEGITIQQMLQLARRADAWMPEDLQWLFIWAIVFPNADLPGPTYPSSAVEYMVGLFRDYWPTHGKTIAFDVLEKKDLHGFELHDEHNLVALYATIIDRVIDRLVEYFKHEDYSTMSGKVELISNSLRQTTL
ncbi:hypothetical protein F5Y13DRAFT_156748 [Hypoxylon sp. FL1857]|nr:hypothetical protein F5Y13DRAFT_156748 [Hypoxylon sp. FL1857]